MTAVLLQPYLSGQNTLMDSEEIIFSTQSSDEAILENQMQRLSYFDIYIQLKVKSCLIVGHSNLNCFA